MLRSGAHVQIGPYEFLLDTKNEEAEPYAHGFEPLQPPRFETAGQPGKMSLRQELQFWTLDDWSGGEGEDVFDPQDPVLYSRSTDANTRDPGKLRARPPVVVTTIE